MFDCPDSLQLMGTRLVTSRPLVIVGAGGFGREAADVVIAINDAANEPIWDLYGVYDDSPSEANVSRLSDRGIPHLGSIPTAWDGREMHFVVGIGNPSVRQNLAEMLESLGWKPATLIHPAATAGTRGQVGVGTVICGGVQVSTNVHLGRHVHLNPSSTIGHDSVLEDHVSINPAAIVSGEVHIMTRTLIGAGAVILQGLTVGSDVVVGAAACVVRDVVARSVVRGVPAR